MLEFRQILLVFHTNPIRYNYFAGTQRHIRKLLYITGCMNTTACFCKISIILKIPSIVYEIILFSKTVKGSLKRLIKSFHILNDTLETEGKISPND